MFRVSQLKVKHCYDILNYLFVEHKFVAAVLLCLLVEVGGWAKVFMGKLKRGKHLLLFIHISLSTRKLFICF